MILNLTQHPATPEQIAQGVRDLPAAQLPALRAALTFVTLPLAADIAERADIIADLAAEQGAQHAMIGGAGYLMPALEAALRAAAVEPLHAFTARDVVETRADDGAVTKTAVFRHVGFVRTP